MWKPKRRQFTGKEPSKEEKIKAMIWAAIVVIAIIAYHYLYHR